MYLVECTNGRKYFFQLTESMLDFIIEDDLYVHYDPTVFILEGIKFEPFLNIVYCGNAGGDTTHSPPPEGCDVFQFRMLGYASGWVDRYNDFKDMRKQVKDYAIMLEEERLAPNV